MGRMGRKHESNEKNQGKWECKIVLYFYMSSELYLDDGLLSM